MALNCPAIVEPYDKSGLIKSPNIINLNYTNQDFWSLKSRLVDFLLERFGPNGTVIPNTFNDLVEGDIAIMLIENWAFLADTLSFKIDQMVNELFIDTVTEPDNAFRLARLVGFQPQPPIAARSIWTATINNPLLTDLTITTPVRINTVAAGQSITIELFAADSNQNPIFNQDIIIPAGSSINRSIIGLEGRTIQQAATGTGAAGQSVTLGFSPVIWDSVSVQVDGAQWTQVDYFTDSQPRREFRVEFDTNYNGFVMFGNNRAGMIPSAGSSIQVTYRVGGGVIGNIVTGSITNQQQVAVPGFDFSVPITYQNVTKGEFGYDGDGIEDIRRKLPVWVRTQNRCVSGTDYKTMADQFSTPYQGQIGKSTAVLRNYGCAGNVIDLYVLARDGVDGLAKASNDLKVALIEQLNTVKMATDFVCVRNGTIIMADVTIEAVLDKFYRKFEDEIRTRITQQTGSFFSINNWDFGDSLKDMDLIKSFSTIKEVESFTVNFVTDDQNNSGTVVTAQYFQIIRPDTITISFLYT